MRTRWDVWVARRCRALRLDGSMPAVFSVEALDQASGSRGLEAGRTLHAAGRVTSVEPAYFGVTGCVEDDGEQHQVSVGIRRWTVGRECDCPAGAPRAASG